MAVFSFFLLLIPLFLLGLLLFLLGLLLKAMAFALRLFFSILGGCMTLSAIIIALVMLF